MRSVHGVVLIISLSLLVGCSSGDRYGPVVLEDDLACRIEIDSSVVLRWDSTLSEPDFGFRYTTNSRGLILGGSPNHGRVIVWDSAGNPIGSFGALGEGPGELARGPMTVFVAPDDTLFVRDSRMRWVVFDPSFNFVRTALTGPVIGLASSHTAFLADGSIVSTMIGGVDTSFSMVRVDRNGNVLNRIGPSHRLPGLNYRPFTPDGVGGYWIGPPPGPAKGYVIERWTGEGEVAGTIARNVSWFRADPSYADINPLQNTHEPRNGFPYPNINGVHMDAAGFLWVMSDVPVSPGIASRYDRVRIEDLFPLMLEGFVRVIEVFDARAERLVASIQVPSYPFLTFLPNDDVASGYRMEEDSLGNREITMMKFSLLAGSSGSVANCRPS